MQAQAFTGRNGKEHQPLQVDRLTTGGEGPDSLVPRLHLRLPGEQKRERYAHESQSLHRHGVSCRNRDLCPGLEPVEPA